MPVIWLEPTGDGTLGSWTDVPSGDAHFLDIDDYSTVDGGGSHDSDTSYIQGPNKVTNADVFFDLTDTAGDFTPTGTTYEYKIACRENSSGNDTIRIILQVFKSDETTALTDATTINGGAAIATSYTEYSGTLTQTGTPTKAE